MEDENVELALLAFRQAINEQKRRQKRKAHTDGLIRRRKAELLLPVRKLLKKLDSMHLVVNNAERYSTTYTGDDALAPQVFRIYEAESSDSWAPGTSLFFDHPAQVEIAIPNERDQDRLGVVVIRSISRHPDQILLQGPFRTVDTALIALSTFLAKNTARIDSNGI